MNKREEQLIRDAAALWKGMALYLGGGGNYRWHRQHMLPRGKVAGKIAVPYNKVAKKYQVDLHALGAELGFSDADYRLAYLKKRRLLPPDGRGYNADHPRYR